MSDRPPALPPKPPGRPPDPSPQDPLLLTELLPEPPLTELVSIPPLPEPPLTELVSGPGRFAGPPVTEPPPMPPGLPDPTELGPMPVRFPDPLLLTELLPVLPEVSEPPRNKALNQLSWEGMEPVESYLL